MVPESLKTPAMPHMVERPTCLRGAAREEGTASEQVPGEPFVEPSVKQVEHVSAAFHAAQSDPSRRFNAYAASEVANSAGLGQSYMGRRVRVGQPFPGRSPCSSSFKSTRYSRSRISALGAATLGA